MSLGMKADIQVKLPWVLICKAVVSDSICTYGKRSMSSSWWMMTEMERRNAEEMEDTHWIFVFASGWWFSQCRLDFKLITGLKGDYTTSTCLPKMGSFLKREWLNIILGDFLQLDNNLTFSILEVYFYNNKKEMFKILSCYWHYHTNWFLLFVALWCLNVSDQTTFLKSETFTWILLECIFAMFL